MTGIAQIVSRDGGLILPLRTPYDRQLVFEHVADYTKRHGCVRLTFGRSEWTVALANERSGVCTRCRERPDKLAYMKGERTLCHPCAVTFSCSGSILNGPNTSPVAHTLP